MKSKSSYSFFFVILEKLNKGKGEEGIENRYGLAIDMYCHRIKKYIGAYIAVIGKIDAIIFTGGVGENAKEIRKRVCDGLEHLNIIIDDIKNENCTGKEITRINSNLTNLSIFVVPTNEELEIAQQSSKL